MEQGFRVGEWRVKPDTGTLTRGQERVRLEPKAMEVLVFLAHHAGKVLSKERLIRAVWADTFVGDDVLAHAISVLRKAFGEDAANSNYIETLPRRGYRLTAKVEFLEERAKDRGVPVWLWIVAVVALCTLTATLTWLLKPTIGTSPGQAMHTSVVFPENIRLPGGSSGNGIIPIRREILLSSNGKVLIFSGRQEDDPTIRLYRRPLDRKQAFPIAGTEGGRQPFLSPDGQWIGFWAEGKLKKVPIEGGIPFDLAEVGGPFDEIPPGACWLEDGRIVLGTVSEGLVWVPESVPESGGSPNSLTEVDEGQETRHVQPWGLPGGRRLLFTVTPHMYGVGARIEALDLPSGTRRRILEDAADGRYLPTGHLLFVRRGQLMAVPFDPERLEVTATPVPVLDGVQQAINIPDASGNSTSAQFWVSDSGVLAYASGRIFQEGPNELVWVDRQGEAEPVTGFDKPLVVWPSLSPDGARVAFAEAAISGALWLFDLNRYTHDCLLPEGMSANPVWSPDGEELAFAWSAAGARNVWALSVDHKKERRRLTHSSQSQRPSSWSSDGKYLAIFEYAEIGGGEVLIYNFDSKRLEPFSSDKIPRAYPRFSPDGRWLAYSSMESGRPEVYVTSFPDRKQTLMISHEGGLAPGWSPSGKELFYSSPQRTGFWQVDIVLGDRISASVPRLLFSPSAQGLIIQNPVPNFSMDPKGERFLFLRGKPSEPGQSENQAEPITRLNLVTNWFEELRAKVPVK